MKNLSMIFLSNRVNENDEIVEVADVSFVPIIISAVVGGFLCFIGHKFNMRFLKPIGILLFITITITVMGTHLGYSHKKLLGMTGIVLIKSMDSPLNKVDNVIVKNGLLGLFFGYSTLEINTSSGKYRFFYINNADEFKRNLMETVDLYEKEKLNQQAQQMYAMNMQAQRQFPMNGFAQPQYPMNGYPQPQYPMNGYPQQPQGYQNYNQPMQ